MVQQAHHSNPRTLTRKQRATVYDNTCRKITRLYFDPDFRGTNWPEVAKGRRDEILDLTEPESFESGVHSVVTVLGTSHTGFFHKSVRRVPARLAIGATCVKAQTEAGERWVVRDVHDGGPAHRAGLVPTDILLAVDGKDLTPQKPAMFPMGTKTLVSIERDGRRQDVEVDVPAPRSRKQPYSEPRSVLASHLAPSLGYLKVTIFPGLIGIDVAAEIDAAFKELSDCDRLVLDLRGHLGGGLGVIRLMSHLIPDRVPIGYTISRKRLEQACDKERLPKLGKLPRNKVFGILGMAVKYAWRDPSVVLVSEGLGSKRCHDRIVILTNEGTVSAGEMICAFARERRLATLVGTETAGRMIPGTGFRAGHGYMVIFPKAAYVTWGGETFEGRGIKPDVLEPWSADAFRQGRDNQLERAIEVVNGL
jgi:carboxyl-terminal processing protease